MESEYVSCPCGSTIKRSYYPTHCRSIKHQSAVSSPGQYHVPKVATMPAPPPLIRQQGYYYEQPALRPKKVMKRPARVTYQNTVSYPPPQPDFAEYEQEEEEEDDN